MISDIIKHRSYFIYLDKTHRTEGSDDIETILDKGYGKDNFMRLNYSDNWIVKVPNNVPLSDILQKIGISNEGQSRGVAFEFISGYFNGWYSPSLWDFIRKPPASIQPDSNKDADNNVTDKNGE